MMKRELSCLATFFIATSLAATLLTKLSNGEMVAQADAVVIGRCTGSEGKWEDRNLFTFTTIAVEETLKGPPASSITVVLPGGSDPKGPVPIGMDFEGASVIVPGEEVFLFLQQIAGIPNAYSVVGYSQG